MRALTWQGRGDVRVEDVRGPQMIKPTDAIIRITSTAICGSDLHLYNVLGPFTEFGIAADTPGIVTSPNPEGVVDALIPLLATHRVWERPDPERV